MAIRSKLTGALIALATAAPLPAKTAAPAVPPPQLRALDACRAIADNGARLACFDRTAAALLTATRSGELNVVDRGQLRQARRSLFGFAMPKLPFFAGDRSAEEDQSTLETRVKSVRALANDRYRVVIADGDAVWETSESYMTFTPPRAGDKLSIKRGPLGSFFLQFAGQRGVRGRRVG